MNYEYTPKGTCSQKMIFDINDDNIIENVKIIGGCPGNLLGISKILVGMSIDLVIERFDGVKCGNKNTSCPDQIAQALKQINNK